MMLFKPAVDVLITQEAQLLLRNRASAAHYTEG